MELGERWALLRNEHGWPEYLVIAGSPGDVWRQRSGSGAPGFASFEIYAILGTDYTDGEGVLISPLLFSIAGARSSADSTVFVHEAERFAHGSVKWDGCSDFLLDDNGMMLHVCDASGILHIGQALALAYDICAQIVGAPDGS